MIIPLRNYFWPGEGKRRQRGVALILTFLILLSVTTLVLGFVSVHTVRMLSSRANFMRSKTFWVAEAGIHKAEWFLKTPPWLGGMGENWTIPSVTEPFTLPDGTTANYTFGISRYDFALRRNGSTASDSGYRSPWDTHRPEMAIDGSDSTFWQSSQNSFWGYYYWWWWGPPVQITIHFPYPLTVQKVRFYVDPRIANPWDWGYYGSNWHPYYWYFWWWRSWRRWFPWWYWYYTSYVPMNYRWEVSSDGVNFVDVGGRYNNYSYDVTDKLVPYSGVRHLRLHIYQTFGWYWWWWWWWPSTVRISTLEVLGSEISSAGTLEDRTRTLRRRVTADDASRRAFEQIDWNDVNQT